MIRESLPVYHIFQCPIILRNKFHLAPFGGESASDTIFAVSDISRAWVAFKIFGNLYWKGDSKVHHRIYKQNERKKSALKPVPPSAFIAMKCFKVVVVVIDIPATLLLPLAMRYLYLFFAFCKIHTFNFIWNLAFVVWISFFKSDDNHHRNADV